MLPPAEPQARDLVKSAARSLDVLEYLASYPGGASLTDIRQHLNIPISSLHGLLMTMIQKNFVVRDETSLLYRLGPKVGQLANSYYEQLDLIQLAIPFMARLTHLTGETTSLTVLRQDQIVFVHKMAGEGVVQIVNPVGTTLPAHATGSGKVMLAHLPAEDFERIYPLERLPSLTANTLTSKKQLKALLPEIAACGYAFDNEESNLGVWAVAACIRDRLGSPAAALSVVGVINQVFSKDYLSWPQHTRAVAAEISNALGFHAADG